MADFYFEFSGVQGNAHVSDTALGGLPMEAGDLTVLTPRPAGILVRLGWLGSIRNLRGVELALKTLVEDQRYEPGKSRFVIYGYSAGGVNALELCRRFEKFNQNGPRKVTVDLLVTVDAAAREETDKIDRTVAPCVKRNVNFWQDESWFNFLGASHGAVNTGPCNPVNRRLGGKFKLRGKLVEVDHGNIDDITGPDALVEMQTMINTGKAPAPP